MTTRVLALAALLCAALPAATAAQSSIHHSDTGTNQMDRQFTMMAAMGGTAEIALSKVAVMRSKTPAIQNFASTMIHDHTIAGHNLAVTAQSVHLPAPMMLDAKHRALRAKLMRMSGKQFDSAYMSAMIADHAQTVSLFQKEIASGENAHVTNFATKGVGMVQNHLQMAHDMTGTQNAPSKIKNPPTM